MEIDNDELQRLYEESSVYAAFFEDLANKRRRTTKVDVDLAVRKTNGTRKEIIDLFKKLEDLGAGEFVVGRRGKESRLELSVDSRAVGKAAAGEPVEIEHVESLEDEDAFEEDDNLTRHDFRLRKGLVVSFDLPDDLTQDEVERLGTFLRSLPLA